MQRRIVCISLLLGSLIVGAFSACSETALISGSSHKVSDSYLTASSQYGGAGSHGPARSRLNTKDENGKAGAWCAIPRTTDQWIQVDLGKTVVITSVATQGRNLRLYEWVTSYQLQYNDGRGWNTYKENGGIKTFSGNSNQDSVRKHTLKTPIAARFIRLNPRTWNNWICLRWELYGCAYSGCTSIPVITGSSYKVSDCQLSASTEYPSSSSIYLAQYSRLNNRNGYGCWLPYPYDYNQWIQVDFKRLVLVSRIGTQGRYISSSSSSYNSYRVTSFYVLYSEDGYTWTTYKTGSSNYNFGPQTGSLQRNYEYRNTISYPFLARFVRVNPRNWSSNPCLRWEIYGCPI